VPSRRVLLGIETGTTILDLRCEGLSQLNMPLRGRAEPQVEPLAHQTPSDRTTEAAEGEAVMTDPGSGRGEDEIALDADMMRQELKEEFEREADWRRE
jgi:hypothetical protein